MKPKTAIFLLVALLVLVGYVVIRQSDWFSGKKPDESKLLFEKPFGKPVRLSIAPADGEKLVFVLKDGRWNMIQPVEAKAIDQRVEKVLQILTKLKYSTVYAANDSDAPGPSVTGLDKPLWTLTAEDEAGKTRVLDIGKAKAASSETYVRPSGDKRTFLLAARQETTIDPVVGDKRTVRVAAASDLSRTAADYRDKDIIDVPPEQVDSISIASNEEYELARGKDGLWNIIRPISAPADEDQVSLLASKLAKLAANSIVSDKPKDPSLYGLDRPAVTVRMRLKPEGAAASQAASGPAGKTLTLLMSGATQNKVFAKLKDQPTVFELKSNVLTELSPKMADIRDKRVVVMNAPEVTQIDIDLGAGGKTSLNNENGQWRMTSPLAGKANAGAVNGLIEKVLALRADSFRDNATEKNLFNMDKPAARISMHLAGRGDPVVLLVASTSTSPDVKGVKTASSDSVAVVPAQAVEPLLAGPAAYWDTTLKSLPPEAAIVSLVLNRLDNTFILTRPAGGEWSMTQPVSAPADAETVAEITGWLRDLRVAKIVSIGSIPDTYAKAKQLITVTVGTESPAAVSASLPASAAVSASMPASRPAAGNQPSRKVFVMHVAKVNDRSYAWVLGGPPVVGELPTALYDVLAGELRNKQVVSFKPDDIKRLKVTAGKDVLELKRQELDWINPADSRFKAGPGAVESYLSEARMLRAERFVSYSSADAAKFGLDKPSLVVELIPSRGEPVVINVSPKGPDKSDERYAAISGVDGVFVLHPEIVKGLATSAEKLSSIQQRPMGPAPERPMPPRRP